MADNSNDWHFKRGLKEAFRKELESLAKGGWFADVLADPECEPSGIPAVVP
jgi:hypothetical protein